MNLGRKIKRKKFKEARKQTEKDLSEKLNMFDRLPSECNACTSDFDKKNREMVMSWNVVVREETVRLYCPKCWSTAQSAAAKVMGETNE